MRISVSYIYGENYSELSDIARPSLIAYCAKHNYDCQIKCVSPNDKKTYAFIRSKNTRELLENYDAILQLEGDMLITNTNYKIEDWLQEDKDFYTCVDINGVNTGSWIAKSTQWMKETLDHICTLTHLWDEQAFWETFRHHKIKYLPHPSINSVLYDLYAPTYGKVYGDKENVPKPTHEEGNWEQGDFILHCPGMELSQRINIFNEYKNKIVL